MKRIIILLLCLAFAASATVRTGGAGYNAPALVEGTYTVEASYPVGLSNAYGLAIQDEAVNSIWISNYGTLLNNEFDMATGAPGATWSIYDGVDPDDTGYCVYASTLNEFFFGDWSASYIAVYDVSDTGMDPFHKLNITGPATWDRVCGVAAGHDHLYASSFFADEIGWGPYTGIETTVTWTTASFTLVSGMAVYGDNLFVCTQVSGSDNIFIFDINPDGSVNMTPVWSCVFTEEPDGPNGGIDYDGEFLWVYPQNCDLYKLDIDWVPSALQNETWGTIKASF